MANELPLEQTPQETLTATEAPTPAVDDPGGAHAKGYSAEPGPLPHVNEEGPVPLVPAREPLPSVRVPERDDQVQPTGRRELEG